MTCGLPYSCYCPNLRFSWTETIPICLRSITLGLRQVFRAKTVFVIGAGASFEVGLPLGKDLLGEIVKLTDIKFEHYQQISGDHVVLNALKVSLDEGGEVKKLNEHLLAAWQLAASARQAKSIDAVIDALECPKVELVGKVGIARAILAAEKSSKFFAVKRGYPDQIDIKKFGNTWYAQLSSILFDGLRKSEVDRVFEKIEIINFNYDRCIETYLAYSIAEYYGLNLPEAQAIVRTLVMHRPYGSIGKLPWYGGERPHVQFGQAEPQDVASAAGQVRTFTEQVEEGEALNAIRNATSGADRIVFLGFGFHRQNIELIAQGVPKHCEILGTAYGLSDDTKGIIRDELRTAFEMYDEEQPMRINLAALTCADFIAEHSRRLTAEPLVLMPPPDDQVAVRPGRARL